MDLDELRSVQSKERRKDSLQHLRDSFYDDVAAYLAERKRQRDERAASVESPFSDEQVRKLSDEIETAEEVVESLYERRVGKVVKLASFAAAGAPTDTDGMTIQEAELFEDLVVRIETNKQRVLEVLERGGDVDVGIDAEGADSADTAETAASPATGGETAADAPNGGPADGVPGDPTAGDPAAANPSATNPATDDRVSSGDDGGDVLADAMGGGDDRTTGDEPSPGTDAAQTDAVPSDTPQADTAPTEAPAAADDVPGEFVPGSEPDRAGGGERSPPDAATSDPTGGATGGPGATDPGAAGTAVDDDADTAAAADTADTDAADSGGTSSDRRIVRITSDVGTILGVDEREYDLAAEDVVTLPEANATPLVERDAAELID